jgi:hypothetical protein
MRPDGSIWLGAREFDHLAPLLSFGGDKPCKVGGRAAASAETEYSGRDPERVTPGSFLVVGSRTLERTRSGNGVRLLFPRN